MANQPHPDDPYRFSMTDDGIRRKSGLDNELQPDPELAEAPASGGRVAMLAVAVAVILGGVFYGLNNAPIHQAGTSSTAQNVTPDSPPAAPPGMRDVTPRSNMQPGVTTGAAPANPKAPAATAPSGAASNGSTQ
jgi:hypothetical protein